MFNIIDNVASKAVKKYIEQKNIKPQLFEAHNHRVNAEKRGIKTFNNHIIAGLSTCDEIFPSVLWCKLIEQAQDTLNMLWTSCTHPQLSACPILEGPHDFNRVPFDPPGC